MYSVKENVIYTTEIQKSKFICKIIRLNSLNQINSELKNIKKEYKDATHYCYAYKFDKIKRFSDDGEPSGTAGMPILNVIENNNLINILIIVIRYYGGVKLGAGGLVRAYTNSTVNTLNNANIIELDIGNMVKIIFNYSIEKSINQVLLNKKILEKKFLEQIEYTVLINTNDLKILNNYNIKYEIIEKNIFMEK